MLFCRNSSKLIAIIEQDGHTTHFGDDPGIDLFHPSFKNHLFPQTNTPFIRKTDDEPVTRV